MRKYLLAPLLAIAAMLATAAPASAMIWVVNNNIVWFTSPSTLSQVLVGYCEDGNLAVDLDNEVYYSMTQCSSGTPVGLGATNAIRAAQQEVIQP